MSRKLVLVGVFLAVLPVLLVAVKVRGNDPPKNDSVDSNSPFAEDAGAKPSEQKPQVDDPFGDAGAKPDPSTPPPGARGRRLRGPGAQKFDKVDIAKPNPSKADGSKTAAEDVACDEAAERKIRAALTVPTEIAFVDTPLRDVVDYLKDHHHIEIQLDTAAMKDAGADPDAQVTKNIKGISLRSALKLLLEDSKLTYVVHHGVLLITTLEKAQSDDYMETRFYPVEDLVVPEGDGAVDSQPLEDLLTNIVATKSWVDNGGTATLSAFVVGNRLLLVVSQTQEAHEEIENTLAMLRKVGGLQAVAQHVAAENIEDLKSSNAANPKAKVMHLKQRQNTGPVVSGSGMWELQEFEKEMQADLRQKENLDKRIDFLHTRIAATENLLIQKSDPGKHEALLGEYSGEVKALKDLFDARATLKNTPAARRGLGSGTVPTLVLPPPKAGSAGMGGAMGGMGLIGGTPR